MSTREHNPSANRFSYVSNGILSVDARLSGCLIPRVRQALVLLVYNCARWREEDYYETIGHWLDLLSVYAPGVVVKIVATQSDLLYADEDYDDDLETRSMAKSEAKSDARSERDGGRYDGEDARADGPQHAMPSHSETVMELVNKQLQSMNDKVSGQHLSRQGQRTQAVRS